MAGKYLSPMIFHFVIQVIFWAVAGFYFCSRNLRTHMKKLFSILVLTSGIFLTGAVRAEDGAALFKSKCTTCHSIGKGTVVGPDLKNVHKKYDEAWLKSWITSSQTKVQSGDPKAVEIFNKFNKVAMPNQDLSDAELNAVIAYIKSESEAPAPVAAAPAAQPQNIIPPAPFDNPNTDPTSIFWYIGVGVVGFLLLAMFWGAGIAIRRLMLSLEKAKAEIAALKAASKS
jgi:cytochrome c551/c552